MRAEKSAKNWRSSESYWGMTTPLLSVRSRTAFWVGACLLLPVTTSLACIQGYHVIKRDPPPKPDFVAAITPPVLTVPKPGALAFEVGGLKMPPPVAAVPQPAPAWETAESRLAYFREHVKAFEARLAGEKPNFEDRTDYAVALMCIGRAPEAVKILVALEVERPDVYTTAANLGTAYELTGNLEAALKWIATGIERNPGSHQGSEWLHVAILRTKLNLRRDAAWLETHSVLDLADRRDPSEIVQAIDYQLGERTQFVAPEDAVVCDLYYQAALNVQGEKAVERRAKYLQESLRYGAWRQAEAAALAKS
jgi:tetratricopeptide (TPR) repeat protein